ncbi:MAG: FkbM family methyltransferase [Prosthecobacter sp.]
MIHKVQLHHLSSPLWLRPSTSDIRVLDQVFLTEEYKLPYGIDPKVIVDGGANIGLTARYFHNKYPDAVVHAIEPEQENFKMLKLNCEGKERVYLRHAAIWPVDTVVGLVNGSEEPWSFECMENPGQGQATAQTVTMESILKQCGGTIDLLKLDIEGAEKILFEMHAERWLPHVKLIVVELHDRCHPGCANALFNAIHGLHFRLDARGETLMIQFL